MKGHLSKHALYGEYTDALSRRYLANTDAERGNRSLPHSEAGTNTVDTYEFGCLNSYRCFMPRQPLRPPRGERNDQVWETTIERYS